MNTDVRLISAALNSAWVQAQASVPADSLRDVLQAKSGEAFSAVSGGSIKSTSGNGHSVVFASGQELGPTQTDMISVWEYLVELFDRAKSEIGESALDEQVKNQMQKYLRPITGYTSNWTMLQK